MAADPREAATSQFVVFVCLLLATVLFFVISRDDVPKRSSLAEAAGMVEWFTYHQPRRGGDYVRFKLQGEERIFQYLSKAGDVSDAYDALQAANSERVAVLFDAGDPHTPWFEDIAYYTVYGVRVGSRSARSYDDVAVSWRRDNAVGSWTSLVTGVLSVVSWIAYVRKRRRAARADVLGRGV